MSARGVGHWADGFDPDDSRDDCYFKAAVRLAEEIFHGLGVESAGDLLRGGDSEIVAGDIRRPRRLISSLSTLHSASAPFRTRIGIAERVCERTV